MHENPSSVKSKTTIGYVNDVENIRMVPHVIALQVM